MNLSKLRPPKGQNHKKRRLGQGMGTGRGKYSGRGAKGAKSISGYSKMRGFEGGQMPLHMRVPKRGFKNIFANDFSIINLGRIQKAIDAKRLDPDQKISEEVLRGAGLVHKSRHGIRLLGDGELKSKIDIDVAGASVKARKIVEGLGGTLVTRFKKPVRLNRKGEPGKKVLRRQKSAEKRAERG